MKFDIGSYIANLRVVNWLVEWSKDHSLPGFFKVPIYEVFYFLAREVKNYTIILRANAVAFSFFLSLFPSAIVLFTLLPYLPLEGFKAELYSSLSGVVPAELFTVIEEVVDKPQKGLLSISFLLAVFFSSNGMLNLIRGFEKTYKGSFIKRSGLQKRFVAIKLTILLGFLLVISIALIIMGKFMIGFLVDWLQASQFQLVLFQGLKWLITLFLFYTIISIIYNYGPAIKDKPGYFTPGATLATILSILSSVLFSIYVQNFNRLNEIYGSLATFIVVMIWMQINAFILIVGFELNASIVVSRDRRRLELSEENE